MQQKRSQNSGRIIDMKHYTVEITNEALADMEQLYITSLMFFRHQKMRWINTTGLQTLF